MTKIFIPPTVRHTAKDRGIGYSIAVSVTGTRCDLLCPHCFAKVLEHMLTVEQCLEVIREVSVYPRMVLISGGCDYAGRVPLDTTYRRLVYEAKSRGFIVAVHTCVTDYSYAKALLELGVDVALIDAEIDHTVLHFIRKLHRYEESILISSIESLKRVGVKVYPHIVVGLHPRGRGLEYEVIDILTTIDVDALSIVVFTPLPSTPYEYRSYPDKDYVKSVMRYAERRIGKPVSLGCMRPREWVDLEEYAYELGFDAIANPSLRFVDRHRDLDVYNLCCSYIALDSWD